MPLSRRRNTQLDSQRRTDPLLGLVCLWYAAIRGSTLYSPRSVNMTSQFTVVLVTRALFHFGGCNHDSHV